MKTEQENQSNDNEELIVPMEQLDSFEFEFEEDEDEGFFFDFAPGEE